MTEYRYVIDETCSVSGGPSSAPPRPLAALKGPDAATWLGALNPAERDLFRVGAAVLACDRLSPRRTPGLQIRDRWQRPIWMRVTLEEPTRWMPHVSLLQDLLGFMTDDAWSIEFQGGVLPPQQRKLPLADFEPTGVALYSGGLDSSVGLLDRSRNGQRRLLAVCVCGTDQQRAYRAETFQQIETLGACAHLVLFLNQLRKVDKKLPLEATQRTRCFFFLAVGAAAASHTGAPTVEVFEPGVGAINIPLSAGQVGAEATRALHPRTLVLFNRLLELMLDKPVRVVAPYFLHTKAELCRTAGNALARIAERAISCDEGERNKVDPSIHCGLCSSCLFRRIALHGANCIESPQRYRDLLTTRRTRYELRLFDHQADRLDQLETFEDLLDIDPDLNHALDLAFEKPLTPLQIGEALTGLFRRYARETRAFLTEAHPQPKPVPRPANQEGRP